MTREQQEEFRPILEAAIRDVKTEIANSKENTQPISPDVAIGRLSRLDSMQMQQMALEAQRRQQLYLIRLEEALNRLNQGNYGLCLKCRNDITTERLRYQPDAVLCMRCAR